MYIDACIHKNIPTEAAPRPCALAPSASPTDTSSSTPILFNTFSLKLAPRMHVAMTIKAESDGSAPVSVAPASASGVVILRVSGANAVWNGCSLVIPASTAELNKPNRALRPVVAKVTRDLRNNISRYWYSWRPKESTAGPSNAA